MADDDTPKPEPKPDDTPKPEPKPDDTEAMKAALKKANGEAAAARARVAELENAGKTEMQRLTDENADLKKQLGDATVSGARLKVALAKGLTATQAKRLAGTTEDELEADADELLADLGKPAGGAPAPKPAPPGKPTENLKPGGGDPDVPPEETDVKKLGARMFES